MTPENTYAFDPDWVVPPGETLREWAQEAGFQLPYSTLAVACGRMPLPMLLRIMEGKQSITRKIAQGLEMGTGVPVRFWLNMERIYRNGLKAGKKVVQ